MVLLLIWYTIDNNKVQEVGNVKNAEHVQKQEISNLSEQLRLAQKAGDITKAKKIEKEIENRLPDNLKLIVETINKNTLDLDFYGKVLDQYGEPVSNAEIKYVVSKMYHFGTTARGVVNTDLQGVFNIKASGYRLTLYMPEHPELSNRYMSGTAKKPFESGGYVILEPVGRGEEIQSWRGYTISDPYIIRGWRVDSFDKVLHKRINLFVKPDGSFHTFLKKNQYGRMALADGFQSDGYLLFTCVRDENGSKDKNGAWQVTIKAIEGGIVETGDVILNEAPLDGYQDSITEGMKGGGPYGSSLLKDKKYYFHAKNNAVYGSLAVWFEPYAKEKTCVMSVDYKINLDGSRNLAVPGKSIN
jgi:hypothetical protein